MQAFRICGQDNFILFYPAGIIGIDRFYKLRTVDLVTKCELETIGTRTGWAGTWERVITGCVFTDVLVLSFL
jgi:hypothetical protein